MCHRGSALTRPSPPATYPRRLNARHIDGPSNLIHEGKTSSWEHTVAAIAPPCCLLRLKRTPCTSANSPSQCAPLRAKHPHDEVDVQLLHPTLLPVTLCPHLVIQTAKAATRPKNRQARMTHHSRSKEYKMLRSQVRRIHQERCCSAPQRNAP